MPALVLVAPVGIVALSLFGFVIGVVCGLLLAGRHRGPTSGPTVAARPETEPAAPTLLSPLTRATPVQAEDPRIDRALGALPLGVVVTDAQGRTVYQNRFARQFERGRHGAALVQAGVTEVVAGAMSGQVVERPLDLYGPPARNLLLRGSPTWEPGDGGTDELTGSVVLIEDVTVAQQVDRIRKDFVANVSHELRTPVGAIGVLAETLRDSDDPEVVDRLAGRLHIEALRLGDIIDDLLALSKLESGQIDDPELMDLHQVAMQAIERAGPGAEQRDVSIHIFSTGAAPVFVEGDQAQMVSAVNNLLDNAIKYSEVGAEVSVTIARADDQALLTVADTGVGIPESAHQRIFERFYRVDDARSRATGGTGLGLSIVRHVVINHRGTISVSSLEGQGSSFTMRLPLADPDSSE